MLVKTNFYATIVGITVCGFMILSCQSSSEFFHLNYNDYVNNEAQLDMARSHIKSGKFEEAIISLNNYYCQDIMCRFKNIMLSDAYRGLGETDKAISYGQRALELGHDLYYIDSISYGDAYDYLADSSQIYQSTYEERIDTNYRKEIQEMIAYDQKIRIARDMKQISKYEWLEKLDSLVELKGWPSINEIGYPEMGRHPSLLVMHMRREDCEEYLKKLVHSCYLGDDSWMYAESIVKNIIMRQTKDNPLCFTVGENGKITVGSTEVDDDFLFLSITKALRDNPQFTVTISTTFSEDRKVSMQNKVRKYFFQSSVPSSNIIWSDHRTSNAKQNEICINNYVQ